MATVNIMKSKRSQTRAGLAFILSYCKRDSKTRCGDRKLVSGINCVPESVYHEMMNTKMHYDKPDGRMFYHITQSFHPDEPITPELAHEIALRFAKENFGDYEVLVATHTDKSHIHSHLVVNSVSCETGYKYHSDNENIERLRQASDRLCLEYSLSVVEPKAKSNKQMSAREYHSASRGESWKMQLIVTIEEAMKYARSKEHFIALMEAEGYEVKWTDERKNITYTTPDGRKCRDSKLHEEKFLKENMEYEFRIRNEITERAEGIGSQTDEESHRGRTVRNGHRGTLESDDRITENAGRAAHADTRYASEPCDEERTHESYGSADRYADEVLGCVSGRNGRVSGTADELGNGYREQDDHGSGERDGTGWESERELFEEYVFGEGNDGSVHEAAQSYRFDPDRDTRGLGTDTAYFIADLTNIIDEDAYVEDCTTMHYAPSRKKKEQQSGPVMGGM